MFHKSKFSLPILLTSVGSGICLFSCGGGGGGGSQSNYLPIGTVLTMNMSAPITNPYLGAIILTVTGPDIGTINYSANNAFPGTSKPAEGTGIPFYYRPDPFSITLNFTTGNEYLLYAGPLYYELYTNFNFSAKIKFKENEKNQSWQGGTMTYKLSANRLELDGVTSRKEIPDGTGEVERGRIENM